MEIEAYFFDFDGVLVDSVPIKARAFAILFESYGSEIENRVVEHHLNNGGMTRKEKIHYYFENYINKPVTEKILDEQCEKFSSIVENSVAAAEEIKGATVFLKRVSKKTDCFIVSATPDDELIRIVEKRGIKDCFIEISGSGKSKTDTINYLLKKYSLNSSRCIFFGDAMSDCIAARNCSVPFIGILPDKDAPLLKTAPDILWFKDFNQYLKERKQAQ